MDVLDVLLSFSVLLRSGVGRIEGVSGVTFMESQVVMEDVGGLNPQNTEVQAENEGGIMHEETQTTQDAVTENNEAAYNIGSFMLEIHEESQNANARIVENLGGLENISGLNPEISDLSGGNVDNSLGGEQNEVGGGE
ncbi:hypothetical protein JCGZ_12733 [Jatropha curcas]|uniref:Uncharacterized protein n=1 Tax=Jatropha curcas TaxID=180498 RepID=A0A067KAH8_JATCU|nr:hypothetical protein JCGZ_12733 [Jatropha curcas]